MAVCWSIALADRINLLKAETESANRDLRNSEHRLSQILEGMPLGVILYGKDQKPKYVNQRTVDILSNPAKASGRISPLGAPWRRRSSISHSEWQAADQEYPLEEFPGVQRLARASRPPRMTSKWIGGQRVPLEIWASPVRDDAGKVESAVVAFQDITQRKQAEAELVEYRKHLETAGGKKDCRIKCQSMSNYGCAWSGCRRSIWSTRSWHARLTFTRSTKRSSKSSIDYFAVQDTFIAELEEGSQQLKILAHSCHSELHPDH